MSPQGPSQFPQYNAIQNRGSWQTHKLAVRTGKPQLANRCSDLYEIVQVSGWQVSALSLLTQGTRNKKQASRNRQRGERRRPEPSRARLIRFSRRRHWKRPSWNSTCAPGAFPQLLFFVHFIGQLVREQPQDPCCTVVPVLLKQAKHVLHNSSHYLSQYSTQTHLSHENELHINFLPAFNY